MDPFYNNNGYNNASSHRPPSSNQHLNPNNQLANNATSVQAVPPNMSAGQLSSTAAPGGMYSANYSAQAQANASNAQYRLAAAASAAGHPVQYGGQSIQQPVPSMQQQQQPAPFASPPRPSSRQQQQQQMYNPRNVTGMGSPAANYSVPNPLGIGGTAPAPVAVGGGSAPSNPAPTGPSKTDLLRSMYQSRQHQQRPPPEKQSQPVQQVQPVQGVQGGYRQPGIPQRPASSGPANTAYANVQSIQQQPSSSSYRHGSVAQQPQPIAQQGMQATYQQQRSPLMSSQQMLRQRQMTSQPMQQHSQHPQQVQQQTSQQQAYQQQQQQSNRMAVQPQYSQQQQVMHSSQPQQARQGHSSRQSHTQSQSGSKQRFHLTPQAKVALREAVLSAIRHPQGAVDPGCLQRAMAQGLPEKAILNAAVVARERDRKNREEKARQQQQGGMQGQGHATMQRQQQAQQHRIQQHQSQRSSQQQQQSMQQPHGAVVHHPGMSRTPTYPPPSNSASTSAKAQMQQMFTSQPSASTVPYGQTAQQQQQNRLYQQQQATQKQQASISHIQQLNQRVQQHQATAPQQAMTAPQMTQYQRQLQAQQVAQQQKAQEDAKRKKLELQYKQEQKRRRAAEEKKKREMEEERRRKAVAAAEAAAKEAARKKAILVRRMKIWGRPGFSLSVRGNAKGLPPQEQQGQQDAQKAARANKALKQSTWGGASLCQDTEPALIGALKRSGKKEEHSETPENIKSAIDMIRKQLLVQPHSLPKTDAQPPSKEQLRRKRSLAISSKLLDSQRACMMKRLKLQPKRESKFLDKHIRRARQMTADTHSKRHKELLKAIVNHQSEFYKFHQIKKKEAAKLARAIRDQLKKAEVAKEKEADAAEKARILALRSNDMAAYTNLLEDTKNERLKFLLDKTDECMNQISNLLSSRVAEEEEDIKLMGGEGTIQATFTQDVTGGSYYETAHVKSEQVRQPSILVGGDLKEYQLSGLQWMVSLYNNRLNGILADEMGLGKTIQAIALLAYLIEVKQNLGPFLVIVPLSTLSNWTNEFAKWLPAATCVCYKGTPQQRKQLFRDEVADGHFNVLLTTYEFVIRDKGSLRKIAWQYAIVDEGHRMKNNQSKFAVTLGTQYNTRRRVLLTGTPLQNNLPELWALLNFLLPAIFNSADTFDQWFNKPFSSFGKTSSSENADGEPSNELLSNEERMLIIHRLHELLRPFMLRRVKSEVLDQLPDKVEKVIRCELSSWQKELYKQISRKIAGEAATKNFNRGLNNVVMQLRKVCNHPYLFSHDGYHMNEDIIRTSGKVELLDRMLPKLKAAGHRVLMFTQMVKMMPILEDYFAYRGMSSLRLDGSTTADEREKRMYMFNAPDSPYFIFLLSTRAGGLGLNLATADTVIIFDSDWNPMMDLQAQDRAHRIGQRKDVRVFRIITQTPVEEKILSRATEKLQMNELVVEAGKFDKQGQDKEDNSLERLKMMELLLTDFDQNQSAQQGAAATSEEGFEKETDDGSEGEVEENKDILNEMISTNDDDYSLYCKMDLNRKDAPALYSDVNDCPDWIRWPNGKPEEGEDLLADEGHPELLGKRRAAAGDKSYDDGLTEQQFCRLMDKQAAAEEKGKKKRKKKRSRNAVDPSLILEDDGGGRKRAKTQLLDLVDEASSRSKFGAASSSSGGAAGNGEITSAMYDRLLSITRSIIYFKEKGTKRKLSEIFLEKPCPQMYPDYYQVVDKPIGMNDILRKCRAKLYSTINDFRDDWNTLFKNALTYNGEGSWIVLDGDVLKGELDRLMDKNALSASAAASKKPVRIKLSLKLKMGKKKKETANGGGGDDIESNRRAPHPAGVGSKSVDSGNESDSITEGSSAIVGMDERVASIPRKRR